MPSLWQTPRHWYELTAEVFPEGHQQLGEPGSLASLISPLDRQLWEIVEKSSDVVAGAWVDTTSNRFDAAIKKQAREKSKNEWFWLDLADSESRVLRRVKVQGIGAEIFDETLSEYEGEVGGPWSSWDSYGGKGEDGRAISTLVSLDPKMTAADAGPWLDWIMSKFKRVKFSVEE